MYISKTLALRAFSVFVFLALVFFFGKAPLERKISNCPDLDLTLWGPALGHTRTSYKVGGVWLKNSGSESILRFCLSGTCVIFSKCGQPETT